MNPEDELRGKLFELEQRALRLSRQFEVLHLDPELPVHMAMAALKRGSRRPHGGRSDFL